MAHEKTTAHQKIILRAFLQGVGEERPKECRKCKTPTICEKLIPDGVKTLVIWVCPKSVCHRPALTKKAPVIRHRKTIPVTQTGIQR